MTPKQVADRLIAERLKVGDNAKALQKESINRQAKARSKAEDIKIQNDAEHSVDIK
jgi:hypothetical protein